nr:MAG TPA: hypothetical protein [Caudoviricetes sp.]
MLNIHLGDTVVTALAKCIFFYNSRKAYRLSTYGVIRVLALAKVHFFGHFWQWANFFSDCFFYRNDYVSDRQELLRSERQRATVYYFIYSKPERSEGVYIKFSVYSLLKRVVLYLFSIV